jgi:hypothetical protein
VSNVLARENEFVVRGERQNQERRASARRGVTDVLAQENEFLVRGERQNQERRALARRGSQASPTTATVYRGVIAFPAHDRHPHHGWLTPAALDSDVRMRLQRNARFLPVRCLPRGADAPRS